MMGLQTQKITWSDSSDDGDDEFGNERDRLDDEAEDGLEKKDCRDRANGC